MFIKMKIFGITIVALQIIGVYSVSKKISVQGDNRALKIAATDIVDKCFGSSDGWSELLIIAEYNASDEIIGEIYHKSKTSNLIVSLDRIVKKELKPPEKYRNYFNTQIEWQKLNSKTTGVIMTVYSLEQLDSVLNFLKNNINEIWKPESYFFIVVERKCDTAEYNNMFKVIWNYWILNAVILCSTIIDDTENRNQSEIVLYTFNPYSVDHSRQWETIVEEIVEVTIDGEKFNHSWYVFKKIFNGLRSIDDNADIFFDKTSNLDGYVVPISSGYYKLVLNQTESYWAKVFAADSRTLESISAKLRFEVVEVVNHDAYSFGRLHENGSYSGMLNDIHTGRSHFVPTMRGMRSYPGLGITYPHGAISLCFISRIIGIRPQWTNLAVAKHIWIYIGVVILIFPIFFYLQNKSHGITSAFLEALRMIIGTSIIHTSTVFKYRIILGSILLVVLVIDGTIRGRFISILTIARPYPNLDTLEQLREEKVDLYGPPTLKNMIINHQLESRYNDSVSFEKCFDIIYSTESQRACFIDCASLTYVEWDSSIIHKSTNPVRESYAVFLTTMHWPMKNRYSFEVQKLVEAGIYNKWKLDVRRKVEINSWKLKRLSESASVRSIKLNDLLPAFVLLFVGLSIALIVFACEIKRRKNVLQS